MDGRSSHPSSSSSSAKSAAARAVAAFWTPEAERSSSMRTLTIFSGAGTMVYWSGSDLIRKRSCLGGVRTYCSWRANGS